MTPVNMRDKRTGFRWENREEGGHLKNWAYMAECN